MKTATRRGGGKGGGRGKGGRTRANSSDAEWSGVMVEGGHGRHNKVTHSNRHT